MLNNYVWQNDEIIFIIQGWHLITNIGFEFVLGSAGSTDHLSTAGACKNVLFVLSLINVWEHTQIML